MTPARHPHKDCHKCPVFFKCEQLPPCATHTSAPAPEPDGCSFRVAKMDAMYDNGYAEGAKAAREQVLDEIIKHLEPLGLKPHKSNEKMFQETIWTTGMLKGYLESLRAQQEPQQ